MQEVIQVSFVNPPKQAGWSGSVKDKNNVLWGVKPDMLPQFSPGNTYTVEYSTKENNGKTYRNISKIVETVVKPQGSPTTTNSYRETSQKDSEQMFVCAILKSYIESGKVDLRGDSLTNATNMIRKVWSDTLGAGPRKLTASEEMNDSNQY